MADEYSINAKITADTSGFENGVNKAKKDTDKFKNSITDLINKLGKNQLVKSLADISLATQGLSKVFGEVNKVVKKTVEAVSECTEAYKVQAQAETLLEQTAKNNPLLDENTVKNLKNYASQLQKISVVGDEQLLPMMAQLAGAGRTEAQIQKIMKTALDLSASGMMSLDSAVSALNGTLNGNAGVLGKQIDGLKGLTEEQLKSGTAIDIVAEKFAGLSESTAKATGTSQQLKNAWGDLQEVVGKPFEDTLAVVRIGMIETVNTITEGLISINEAFESFIEKQITGKKTTKKFVEALKQIPDLGAKIDFTRDKLQIITDVELKAMVKYLSSLKNLSEEEKIIQSRLQAEIQDREHKAKLRKKEAEEQRKYNELLQEEIDRNKQIGEFIDDVLNSLDKEIKLLNVKAKLDNKSVKTQDLRNAYYNAYVKLVTENVELVTEENEVAKSLFEIIKELGEQEKEREEAIQSETDNLKLQQEMEQAKLGIAQYRIDKEKELYDRRKALGDLTAKQVRDEGKNLIQKELDYKLKALDIYQKETEAYLRENYVHEEEVAEDIEELYKAVGEEKRLAMLEAFNKMKTLDEQYADSVGHTFAFIEGLFEKFMGYFSKTKIGKMMKPLFDKLAEFTKKYGESISKTAKAVVTVIVKTVKIIVNTIKTITNIISSVFNIIKKILSINLDDMIDTLLEFEDSILTFFLITLPKLPEYIRQALRGLASVLESVKSTIDVNGFQNWFYSIFTEISDTLPSIFNDMISIITDFMQGMFNALVMWVDEDGFGKLSEGFFDGIINIFTFLTRNVPKLVKIAIRMILNIVSQITRNIPVILKDLTVAIVKMIPEIIIAIVDSLNDIVPAILELIPIIIDSLIEAIPEITLALIQAVPDIIGAVIQATMDSIPELLAVIPKIVMEIMKLISEVPSKILEGLFDADTWKNAWESIKGGVKKGWEGMKKGFKGAGDWFKGLFSGFATGVNNAPRGLALVGEQGPELIDFKGGERVYTADNTQKLLTGGSSGGNSFNVSFYNTQDTTAFTMLKQLKQYNRQMAINGIL